MTLRDEAALLRHLGPEWLADFARHMPVETLSAQAARAALRVVAAALEPERRLTIRRCSAGMAMDWPMGFAMFFGQTLWASDILCTMREYELTILRADNGLLTQAMLQQIRDTGIQVEEV